MEALNGVREKKWKGKGREKRCTVSSEFSNSRSEVDALSNEDDDDLAALLVWFDEVAKADLLRLLAEDCLYGPSSRLLDSLLKQAHLVAGCLDGFRGRRRCRIVVSRLFRHG